MRSVAGCLRSYKRVSTVGFLTITEKRKLAASAFEVPQWPPVSLLTPHMLNPCRFIQVTGKEAVGRLCLRKRGDGHGHHDLAREEVHPPAVFYCVHPIQSLLAEWDRGHEHPPVVLSAEFLRVREGRQFEEGCAVGALFVQRSWGPTDPFLAEGCHRDLGWGWRDGAPRHRGRSWAEDRRVLYVAGKVGV